MNSKLRVFVTALIYSLVAICSFEALAQRASDVTAIDVLLDPAQVMLDRAKLVNERLRADYPGGFALDSDHAPHVTLVQAFVRTSELEKIYEAVAKVAKEENPTSWELKTSGYYDIPVGQTGVAGIVIEPTGDLLRLQKQMLAAIAPFIAQNGSEAAFVPKAGGGKFAPGLVGYVTDFALKSSGEHFNPHVTVGVGRRAYLDKLKAEPFESFAFKARSVSIYQLGDFGTAQKKLWTSAETTVETSVGVDPLPSWNEGKSKQSILDFVAKVTKEGSPDFVPVAERIATFDNDGTLWAEQPVPVQLFFAIDQAKVLLPQHLEWKEKEPFASLLKGDIKKALAGGERSILELFMATHSGMSTQEFEKTVTDWIATARHPVTKRLHTEMIYQPMLELLVYLRANGFKTFIVSGGGIEFMRPWSERVYGIPPEQVIGSSIKTQFELRDGKPVLVRLPELNFVDDKAGKPVGIHEHIGRRPIAAFGNSDGDLAMIQYTTIGNPRPSFGLIVHHTDAEREYAYDRKAGLARLDKALDEAPMRGWTVVDMKQDWKVVYPPEKK